MSPDEKELRRAVAMVERLAIVAEDHPQRLVEVSREMFIHEVVRPLEKYLASLGYVPDRPALTDSRRTEP